jgi:serine palmitoyltransferase
MRHTRWTDRFQSSNKVASYRSSGATIRVFRHGDMEGLESLLRHSIVDGQERSHRPWRKIFIVVRLAGAMLSLICITNLIIHRV